MKYRVVGFVVWKELKEWVNVRKKGLKEQVYVKSDQEGDFLGQPLH